MDAKTFLSENKDLVKFNILTHGQKCTKELGNKIIAIAVKYAPFDDVVEDGWPDEDRITCNVISEIVAEACAGYRKETGTQKKCTCGKCGGSGYIQPFAHYAKGLCFECKGDGVVYY